MTIQFAARVGDMHVCPLVDGVKPHVGGPIAVGCPTVLIGNMPAARVGDITCCAGPPDAIATGSLSVQIASMPAARFGDLSVHGGTISMGHPTVIIGDVGMGSQVKTNSPCMRAAKQAGVAFIKAAGRLSS